MEAERILATHKDVVVPVKEVWLEVTKQGQFQKFEVPVLADFTALLEGDDRFDFLTAGEEMGDSYVDPERDEDVEFETGLERLGFYSEDRVKLTNLELSEETQEELLREARSDEELNAVPDSARAAAPAQPNSGRTGTPPRNRKTRAPRPGKSGKRSSAAKASRVSTHPGKRGKRSRRS
jgi:hypothetical protein